MKTFRYFLAFLAFLVLGAGVAVAASYDDEIAAKNNATWVSRSVTTNTSVGIRLKCLRSTTTGAKYAVTSAKFIVFTSDGSNADTDINTSGTLNVLNPNQATVAKLCDTINASKYWRAIAVDLRPSTTIGAGLVNVSATTTGIYNREGATIGYLTAVVGRTSVCIGPEALASSVEGGGGWNEPQLVNRISNPANTNLSKRVFNNWKYCTANGTYSSGSINLTIWQVYVPSKGDVQRPGQSVPDYANAVETALFGPIAGAATTVAFPLAYSTYGDIRSNAGWQMIVEYAATVPTALTVGTMSVNGQTWYQQ